MQGVFLHYKHSANLRQYGDAINLDFPIFIPADCKLLIRRDNFRNGNQIIVRECPFADCIVIVCRDYMWFSLRAEKEYYNGRTGPVQSGGKANHGQDGYIL